MYAYKIYPVNATAVIVVVRGLTHPFGSRTATVKEEFASVLLENARGYLELSNRNKKTWSLYLIKAPFRIFSGVNRKDAVVSEIS